VEECPVQLEATVNNIYPIEAGACVAVEVQIVRVYLEESILNPEKRHYVDADKWRPLIMSFCEFYGLSANLYPSRLAKVF
jgi:flavin reductase (DIM6/NTAB) family NADH-FMN oxidoreductase RutF